MKMKHAEKNCLISKKCAYLDAENAKCLTALFISVLFFSFTEIRGLLFGTSLES